MTRRELLAVVVFLKHFRPYLLGKKFTLRTDHGSLNWLCNFKDPEGQLARWLEKLQEYDFTVVHRQGKKHQNADAMSRIPCRQCGRPESGEPVDVPISVISMPHNFSKSNVREAQMHDDIVGPILQGKERKVKPSKEEAKSKPPMYRRLLQLWDQLILVEGVLWRQYQSSNGQSSLLQLVVPISMKEQVLQELHGGVATGHLGWDKTLERLKVRFYWPGYHKDVKLWCQQCQECLKRKSPPQKRKAPMQTLTAGSPMQIVAVDILGPLPKSTNGNQYILVVADYFTKWMEAYPIPNQEASTVAQTLVDHFFLKYSPPEQLHSDQGRQFESQLMKEVCKLLGIEKTRTTPYHPQSDGLAERFNRTLLSLLSTALNGKEHEWECHLRPTCMAYNTSVQASTGITPFYLMFGHEARIPLDIMLGDISQASSSSSYTEYVTTLQDKLCTAYSTLRTKLKASFDRQRQYYNRNIHGKPYKDGDLVFLYSTVIPKGRSRKFHQPWTGPYKIVKQLSDAVYRIQHTRNRKRLVVHFDRLKPCPLSETTTHTPPRRSSSINRETVMPTRRHFEPQIVDSDAENTTGAADVHSGGSTDRYPCRSRRPPDRFGTGITH